MFALRVIDFPLGMLIVEPVTPFASKFIVIGGFIVILNSRSEYDDAPVARTVKLNCFATVGVPLIVPVVLLSARPSGSCPDTMLHDMLELTVLAVMVVEYATPRVDPGSEVVVI